MSEPTEGPKVMGGYPGTDNGYARFSQVRIPRWQMLSKFAQVTRDGKYVKPVHEKVSYGGVSLFRLSLSLCLCLKVTPMSRCYILELSEWDDATGTLISNLTLCAAWSARQDARYLKVINSLQHRL